MLPKAEVELLDVMGAADLGDAFLVWGTALTLDPLGKPSGTNVTFIRPSSGP